MAEEKPEVVVVRRKPSQSDAGTAGLSPQARVFWEHFDEQFYLAQFAAEEAEKIRNAAQHYLQIGWKSGLDPSPRFCTSAYLARYSDVREARVNPLEHYAKFGVHEGRIIAGTPLKATSSKRPSTLAVDAPRPIQEAESAGSNRGNLRPSSVTLSRYRRSQKLSDLTHKDMVSLIADTGLVTLEQFLRYNPDLRGADVEPFQHYVTIGYKEGRRIHILFDQEFYLSNLDEKVPSSIPPIIHYLLVGAREGCQPHPVFDAVLYSSLNAIDHDQSNPLIDYTISGGANAAGALRMFDQNFYLKTYPYTAHYPGDPIAHFLESGVFEGCRPCEAFNTNFYYATHLNNNRSVNALSHYLVYGRNAGLAINQSDDLPTVAREIKHFANPGPMFEEVDKGIAAGSAKNARIFAFYLPQFHTIPENDAWWGKGFTEWRYLARGVPHFAGHYQPRIPRDLSFYDLSRADSLRQQVELALAMGISGFAFYFYWFNRRRLLETPLKMFLADNSIEMPFLLIWANENWTRRWDGKETELLIRQEHDAKDDKALVDCFQDHFKDRRYIRINGRPLLVIYRADAIPDCAATLDRWRRLFLEGHGERPLIYMAQTFACFDPRKFGFDGAIEFPPHKIGNNTKPINRSLKLLDFDFTGDVRSYDEAAAVSLTEPPEPFPLIKTVFPSWDNSARQQTAGTIYHGSSPRSFGLWLAGAIEYARKHPVEGENIVFVNAWNEWCEGAYLEPDVHYGGAYINALARAVTQFPADLSAPKHKVLLVGHDAFPAGSQMILLDVARVLRQQFGVDVQLILLNGGRLLEAYKEAVPTDIVQSASLTQRLRDLKNNGFDYAVINTVVCGSVCRELKSAGFVVTSLIHELPRFITSSGLDKQAEAIRSSTDSVVFPSRFVKTEFESQFGSAIGRTMVRPQGLYRKNKRDSSLGQSIRRMLGLGPNDRIVLNIGHGDLRKGVDIFCQFAGLARTSHPDLHFVWVGSLHPDIERWVIPGSCGGRHHNIHFAGYQEDVGSWLNAADVFFLSSREDPFPSVVLEALQVGLPVVAFEGNGGYSDVLEGKPHLGFLVGEDDPVAALRVLHEVSLSAQDETAVARRIDFVASGYNSKDYAFELLKLRWPDLKRVSAIVPNYNYSAYLSARLRTVIGQSYPLYELIILDDASTDDSLAVIRRELKESGREASIIENLRNSGGVFKQWEKALALAKGDLVWIAEADDLAAPAMIEGLALAFDTADDCAFAFCDSRTISENGEMLRESYKGYCEKVAPGFLSQSGVIEAREFAERGLGVANLVLNVSGVLWRRERAEAALKLASKDLAGIKLVGDWLIYLAACSQGGDVVYLDRPLNVHRRHGNSVTLSADPVEHLSEIRFAQAAAARLVGRKRELLARQKRYREETEVWLAEQVRTKGH